jgi:hypothetical protein
MGTKIHKAKLAFQRCLRQFFPGQSKWQEILEGYVVVGLRVVTDLAHELDSVARGAASAVEIGLQTSETFYAHISYYHGSPAMPTFRTLTLLDPQPDLLGHLHFRAQDVYHSVYQLFQSLVTKMVVSLELDCLRLVSSLRPVSILDPRMMECSVVPHAQNLALPLAKPKTRKDVKAVVRAAWVLELQAIMDDGDGSNASDEGFYPSRIRTCLFVLVYGVY